LSLVVGTAKPSNFFIVDLLKTIGRFIEHRNIQTGIIGTALRIISECPVTGAECDAVDFGAECFVFVADHHAAFISLVWKNPPTSSDSPVGSDAGT